MLLNQLRREVFEANIFLKKSGLVVLTWGNVSAIDRASGLVVIKPSGVEYSELTPENMVIMNLDGKVIEGTLKPSSDTPTHLELYKAFPQIGGIAHTHSRYATSWAQAGLGIPPLGTTHADYFYGEIPCTRDMTTDEVEEAYERDTGKVIIERFKELSVEEMPAVLVKNHGPFTWGKSAAKAVENALVLEEIAAMAQLSHSISGKPNNMPAHLMDRHYFRKHGARAYYGQ